LNNNILIVAGEASGDLHGASLILSLKKLHRGFNFYGIGGSKMIDAGLNAIYNINQMAFLGFIEILKHLPFIRRVKRDLISTVIEKKIDTVILIDYPGFNLNLAKKLKKLGLKVIYYISPQIWAWGKGRIKTIRDTVDQMIVVFPFEEKIYKDASVNVEYVGHPLIEHISNYNFLTRDELDEELGLVKEKNIFLILPGSREHEILKIFPECIKAASKLAKKYNLQIVVACAPNLDENLIKNSVPESDFILAKGFTYDLLKHSFFGIIKSGTSTLEAAYFGIPFIVVYSTNMITYWLGKKVVKIKNIAMVNIILGKNLIKELIQNDVNELKIIEECDAILSSNYEMLRIKNELLGIRDLLGDPGSSDKSAKIIFDLVNETNK
jgi:lipid-A-disaccharide synthase